MTPSGDANDRVNLLTEVKPSISDPLAAITAHLRAAGETSAEVRPTFDNPSPAFARFIQVTVGTEREASVMQLLQTSNIVASVTKEPAAEP